MARNPLKRPDASTSEPASWYKDQYQHMIVQRNVLAFLTLAALVASLVCVFFVMRIAEVKTVEPYVVQIDDKTGLVQLVDPVSRNEYAASELIDRFFIARYINAREGYNITTLRHDYNVVRVMSAINVFDVFRSNVAPSNPTSPAAILKNEGSREVRIKSLAYIQNPPIPNQKAVTTPTKIIQARIELVDTGNGSAATQMGPNNYVVTVSFEYASLQLTEEERLINPLGLTVIQYQIQQENA